MNKTQHLPLLPLSWQYDTHHTHSSLMTTTDQCLPVYLPQKVCENRTYCARGGTRNGYLDLVG